MTVSGLTIIKADFHFSQIFEMKTQNKQSEFVIWILLCFRL